MWSDPLADMLTRIRNGARVHNRQVMVPLSKLKVAVASVLRSEGYIHGFDVIENKTQGMLRIEMKYGPRGEDVIRRIVRVSKGGRRVYRGVDDLPRVLDGLGIAIVSTNAGVFSDRECREKSIGGEVLCTVY